MKRKFLPLYPDEYLGILVKPELAPAFRNYLEDKFLHKRKRFRCLADVEEWMISESINFLKDDEQKSF